MWKLIFEKHVYEGISGIREILMEENIKVKRKRKYANGQEAHENMLSIESLGKCKSKHKEIQLHNHYYGYYKKNKEK